jgi:hypothetical protein
MKYSYKRYKIVEEKCVKCSDTALRRSGKSDWYNFSLPTELKQNLRLSDCKGTKEYDYELESVSLSDLNDKLTIVLTFKQTTMFRLEFSFNSEQ